MQNKVKRKVIQGNLTNELVLIEIDSLLSLINTELGQVTSYNEYLDTDNFSFIITITYIV